MNTKIDSHTLLFVFQGVHAKGGPSTKDTSGKVDINKLMDRSAADVRGRKIAKKGKN